MTGCSGDRTGLHLMFGRLFQRDIPPQRLPGIVAPIAERHGVRRIWLFGSRARGDHRRDSDYDFCILMEGGGRPYWM